MKTEPNSYDAAFAAAGLSQRMDDARLNTMTRVAIAACAVAAVEAEDLIQDGDYEILLDLIALNLRNPKWPGPGVQIEAAVREILGQLGGEA